MGEPKVHVKPCAEKEPKNWVFWAYSRRGDLVSPKITVYLHWYHVFLMARGFSWAHFRQLFEFKILLRVNYGSSVNKIESTLLALLRIQCQKLRRIDNL